MVIKFLDSESLLGFFNILLEVLEGLKEKDLEVVDIVDESVLSGFIDYIFFSVFDFIDEERIYDVVIKIKGFVGCWGWKLSYIKEFFVLRILRLRVRF